MWPFYLSGWRVSGSRSTEQAVHMDSGRIWLANGIEIRRRSQSLERLTIIRTSAISGHTVLPAERFSSCSDRQAKPFSSPSPGSGNQFPLPNALQCVRTRLFMASVGPAWRAILHWCVNCKCHCACCSFCFKDSLVPSAILFSSGRELEDVMNGFRDIAQLPMCARADDDTFVHIRKPALWGDTYWCFGNFLPFTC